MVKPCQICPPCTRTKRWKLQDMKEHKSEWKNTQKGGGGTQKRIRHKINHFKMRSKTEGTQESPYTVSYALKEINNENKLL